jgi:hypothetical protein
MFFVYRLIDRRESEINMKKKGPTLNYMTLHSIVSLRNNHKKTSSILMKNECKNQPNYLAKFQLHLDSMMFHLYMFSYGLQYLVIVRELFFYFSDIDLD